jgi:hypothetical protein
MPPSRQPFAAKPKSKTPAERSVEFDATQARLKAEAAARREAQSTTDRPKPAKS